MSNDYDPNRFGPKDDPPTILRCSECGQKFDADDYPIDEGDPCPICPESEATELQILYEA